LLSNKLSLDIVPTSQISPALLAALHRLLSPIARLMLARGITLPMAMELLKRVFVDVAERDFRLNDKTATDSRISLLTGVHRKDVRRLRALPGIEDELPEKVSLGAQLVGAWTTRPPWQDGEGKPRLLPRLASNGGDLSFESLVASVSRDIRPRSVLDEWIRLGVVRINGADQVELQEQAFIPRHGEAEKLAYYGLNLGDHITAATDNVLEVGRPWFERSVHHQGLSAGEVEALRERAAALGMTLLQDLHQQASSPVGDQQVKDRRFTCGVYFYSAPTDGEASQ
jgi:hypothetical protein